MNKMKQNYNNAQKMQYKYKKTTSSDKQREQPKESNFD
jgi:hypothetical protein